MTDRFIIYGLVDPRTDEVRYIGKSSSGLRRPQSHKKFSMLKRDNTHRTTWIKSLLSGGLTYTIKILEVSPDQKMLSELEVKWIAYGRSQGWSLTNHTDGGEGCPGLVVSAETRRKMSDTHKRIGISTTTRTKINIGIRQYHENNPNVASDRLKKINAKRWADFTEHAKMSARMRGRIYSSETRRKMSEAQKNRFQDPEQLEKARTRMLGKPGRSWSAEQRVSLANKRGGRPFKDNLGNTWSTVREAGRVLGLDSSGISKVLKGKRPAYGEYIFKYIEGTRA